MAGALAPPPATQDLPDVLSKPARRDLMPSLCWLWGALLVVACMALRRGPLSEPDVYWHVLLGQDLWEHHRLSGDPSWTYAPHRSWRTTQWGSELLLAGVYRLAGWPGLVAVRLALVGVFAACWVRLVLLPLRKRRSVLLVAVLALFAALPDVQERPAGLVVPMLLGFGVFLGGVLRSPSEPGMCSGPRAASVAVGVLVAAQLHGSWMLVPAALVGAACVVLPRSRGLAARLVGVACLSGLAGLVTPVGLEGPRSAVRIAEASRPFLQEWQPGTWHHAPFAFLLLLVAAGSACVVRQRQHWPALAFLLGSVMFAGLAVRNALPVLCLAGPIIASLVARNPPGVRASRPMSVRVWCSVGAGVALCAALLAVGVGLPSPSLASWLAQAQRVVGASEGSPVRAVTSYNLAGEVLAAGKGRVQVALDGRTDRYGVAVIRDQLTVVAARGAWQGALNRDRVQVAVLRVQEPLRAALVRSGWHAVGGDDRLIVLVRP